MITRFWAETATALVTLAFGLIVVWGALEFGIGWDTSGPQPGAFPFYTGALVALASVGTLVVTFAQRLRGAAVAGEIFLDRERAGRVVAFFAPLVAFVLITAFAGMYVATISYLVYAMRFQGGYGWLVSVASALGAAFVFYVVFERFFQIGLLKGPVERLIGL
ncbi:MAG: tripartite tricarboxylate transporter TctB family protein [Bosea sp. (in: a-proteobacteria)]|uniref:tripartite tricarboxylate transporter TctB family protein n=1 Tax=Bosea sp. (in: a-proteobacteria) TaxID=1871050 RepID=UPI001D8EC965|nr:tripartite tricarboxylate transporter TctB family protein [Bosea sp. (in: a-proteobacteria)]MBX9873326.1 tripartite tricarboxylate transporter TctB family protein [Beijerinckiaceae bacterium]MDP3600600.1 tripartite tricarboxylate transporter TctB family protein [Bosea sp. (in: a-proteobacteria)]